MKIHQLQMGARFEYGGDEYVKTAPLCGTSSKGQRLIPKSALLRPLDGPVQIHKAPPETVRLNRVLAAFAAFYAQCEGLVPDARHTDLDAAREAFLKALAED